jgi:subtilisin family serine protease
MKIKTVFLLAFVATAFLSACNSSQNNDPIQSDRYLVKFRNKGIIPTDPQIQMRTIESFSQFDDRLEKVSDNLFLVKFASLTSAQSAVEKLSSSNDIEYVEPDYRVHTFFQPNDPSFSQQWAHQVIQSVQAWDLSQGSSEVVVAVIDTGTDHNHNDLRDNIWRNPDEIAGNGIDDDGNGYVDDTIGWNFVNNSNSPMADDNPGNHGTHVAGIIGAVGNNGIGVIGASPRVKIMPLKFLSASGSGNISAAVKAIDYAISKRVKIMSNSWGGPQYSQALADAVGRARQAGILFIAAAGNGGSDGVGDNNDSSPNYPSNISSNNVIAVAASNSSDSLTRFSNYGARTVHIVAPGENIYSTKNDNTYQNLSGTSMATPLVSGVVALMYALRPDLSYLQIKQALLDNVDRVTAFQGRVISNGRVNAFRALSAIDNGAPIPVPTPTPTPQPTFSPPPQNENTPTPTLEGRQELVVTNPYVPVRLQYNVSQFPAAAGVYMEISRPNAEFILPNGTQPDPYRLNYSSNAGAIGYFTIYPIQAMPGWGTYKIRIIPLDRSFQQAVGRFSNSAVLVLRPN